MGEGWSDFMSLIITAKPGDRPEQIRGIGNFATSAPIDGIGIRRRPYTTNMSINEFTYHDIDDEDIILVRCGRLCFGIFIGPWQINMDSIQLSPIRMPATIAVFNWSWMV
jgi:hypothetical protein